MAIVMSRRFLRSMAQPFEQDETGVSLWGLADIEARQAAMAMDVDDTAPEPPVATAEDDAFFAGLDDADLLDTMPGLDGAQPIAAY
jgi:DNA excision repair protein ERCC-2